MMNYRFITHQDLVDVNVHCDQNPVAADLDNMEQAMFNTVIGCTRMQPVSGWGTISQRVMQTISSGIQVSPNPSMVHLLLLLQELMTCAARIPSPYQHPTAIPAAGF